MSKRPREEHSENANNGQQKQVTLPRYHDPNANPTADNVTLHRLIAQLRDRFIADLRGINGALGSVIEGGKGNDGGRGKRCTRSTATATPVTDGAGRFTKHDEGEDEDDEDEALAALLFGAQLGCEGAASSVAPSPAANDDGLLTVHDVAATASKTHSGGVSGSIAATDGSSLPPLDALVASLQAALRSRCKAMCMVDMVVQLQQEKLEMVRMRDHMLGALNVADGILKCGDESIDAEGESRQE